MELKYGNMQEYVSKYLSSNCTFMELKSAKEKEEKDKLEKVLIVPLWN